MKNSLLPRKFIVIILIIIALVVYGNLFFKVNKTLTKPSNSEEENTSQDSLNFQDDFPITFTGQFPDPFDLPEKAISEPEIEESAQQDFFPDINLQGIVGKTAILEYEKKLYFLQEGDYLLQYIISYIANDSITVSTSTQTRTLRVIN